MKEKTLIQDLTTGSVTRQLVWFALPICLSNLLQTLYNLVDMVVVGQFVGSAGLSAVSSGGELINVSTFMCMGFASAAQVMISQFVGLDNREAVSRVTGTTATICLSLSLVMTVVGYCLTDTFLGWIQVPEEAWADARGYTQVCFLGMFFIYGYNTVSAILRGMGDSKRPLLFIAIAAVTNLILDLLFVAVFDMGAMGAGLATVIGQALSFVCSVIYLYRHRAAFGFDFRLASFKPDGKMVGLLIRLGVPMMLQHALITVSMLVITGFVNTYGVVASAVTGVGNKLGSVMTVITGALTTAGATMIGQNFAAGKKERVSKTVYISMAIGLVTATVFSIAMALFPEEIFALFNSEEAVVTMARSYTLVAIVNFYGFALRAGANALINGLGYASFGMFVAIMDGVVTRIGAALLFGLVFDWGIQGFWWGTTIAGYVCAFLGGGYFFSGRWKKRQPVVE